MKVQLDSSSPIQLEITSKPTAGSDKLQMKDFVPSVVAGLVSAAASFGVQWSTADSQAKLANRSEELARSLDESRKQFDRESAKLQRTDAETRELLTYRRTQRAELLLPLFKSLPGRGEEQTPSLTSESMTKAYREGAGMFLGGAAPVYHWAKDMLDQLATVRQAPTSQLHQAAHRVVSTLRTALIAEVEGNSDEQWKAAAARTLQQSQHPGIPSFADMRGWKDGQRVLAYLLRADTLMSAVGTSGSWPTEK